MSKLRFLLIILLCLGSFGYAVNSGVPDSTGVTLPDVSKLPLRFSPTLAVSCEAGSSIESLFRVSSSFFFQMERGDWYGRASFQTAGTTIYLEEALAGFNLPSRMYLEAGMLENDLGIEDHYPARTRLFLDKSPARRLAGDLGYAGTDPGLRFYRDPKSDPFEFALSAHLPDGNMAPQSELALFYRMGGKNKGRIGFSLSFFPVRTVDIVTGEGWQPDLFLAIGAADLDSAFRFILEAGAGSVIEKSPALALLSDRPIPRWFLGGDLQAGYAFAWDGGEFVPALRVSYLMPAVDKPSGSDLSILLGGCINASGNFRGRAEAGTEIAIRSDAVAVSLLWSVGFSLDLR